MRAIIVMVVCAMLAGCGTTSDDEQLADAGAPDATCNNVFDVCMGMCGHTGEFCCWAPAGTPDGGPASVCLEQGTTCTSDICLVAK